MPLLLFLAVSVIWSCSFLLMKKAVLSYGPLSVGALRLLGGALVLSLMLVITKKWLWPNKNQLGLLALIIVIGYAMPYCLQPFLVDIVGSGYIGMIVGFVPLLTIFATAALLGFRPTLLHYIGVLGGLLCLAGIFWDGMQRSVSILYLCLAVLVPTGYAISNTLVRKYFKDVPASVLSTWCMWGACLCVAPFCFALEEVQFNEHFAFATACVAVLGIIGTGLVMLMFYHLIQTRGPLFAGMVAYIIPVGALIIGYLDGELVTVLQGAAMVLMLVMVAIVQYAELKTQKISE